ncbi:MAG: Na(+)/H(+) antiporter subunit D [Dongiaceae bacterium]
MTASIPWPAVLPPGLLLVLGGLLLPLANGIVRRGLVLLLPLLTLALIWQAPESGQAGVPFLDYVLLPVHADALSRLFATIFAIMAFAGGVFALNQAHPAELAAALVYAGGAIGVTFAGDLITLFVFWETMALASTVVLWAAGERAAAAGFRYLLIHLLGGVVLMTGIVAHAAASGSVAFTAMSLDGVGSWLILAGFLLNAGAPPLSAWLPDAYPEASPSGMVFLSAFTTKTAVYALLRGFPGSEILIFFGLYMVFYGIIYALLENDMRRILAYSIVNQVGFMVAGIGIGTPTALNGAAAHAFAHIIYKALLLMSAGAVLHMTGKRKCTDLGGLYKSMPLTALFGIVGALSISAFPLTSGFVSKSLISEAAAYEGLAVVWFLLAAASAGVFLHAGIKFPWFVFFQTDSGLRPAEPPANMLLAMALFAALCIGIGVYPEPLYALLPFPVDYVPYTAPHVVSQLQLLLFSGLAFSVMLPQMRRTLTISLDVDWFYRRFGAALARESIALASRVRGGAERSVRDRVDRLVAFFRTHGPDAALARSWATGTMVLWVAVLLAINLILYYM